jgi:hypothetical protein
MTLSILGALKPGLEACGHLAPELVWNLCEYMVLRFVYHARTENNETESQEGR